MGIDKPVILIPVLEITPAFVVEGIPEGEKLYELAPVGSEEEEISPAGTDTQVEPLVE